LGQGWKQAALLTAHLIKDFEMLAVNLSVVVDDQYKDRFSEVVDELKRSGMTVDRQLKSIGVITGSIDSAKVDALKRINGVADVEEAREIQIAPPDSDVQ
jgi:hypothetical protein